MGRGLVVAVAILVGFTPAPRAQPLDEMKVPLIAFEREGSTPPPPQLFVIRPDGSSERRIAAGAHEAFTDPTWSPDGRTILFGRSVGKFVDGPYFLFAMNADGTRQRRLLRFRSGEPAWSPDGSKIAFSSASSGKPAVYVANSDGSGVQRLTRSG